MAREGPSLIRDPHDFPLPPPHASRSKAAVPRLVSLRLFVAADHVKKKNTDLTVQRISQPKERNEQIKRQNHRGHRSARQFNAPSHASTAFQRFTFSISRESLLKASL